MRNTPTITRHLFAIAVAVLLVFMLAACQPDNPAETPTASTGTAAPQDTPESTEVRKYSGRRTLHIETGLSLSTKFIAPLSVQDLVNRHDVVFTGTVSNIGDTVAEKPYDWKPEDDSYSQSLGMPPFRVRVTYYTIQPERVFLDDGNLLSYPLMRLFGYDNEVRPKVGERYLFVLGANPDGKSYGITDNWSLIPLDGGNIRNYDGSATGYVGVTDEAALLSSVKDAAAKWEHLPISQWPVHQHWLSNEDSVSGDDPPTPGDGDSGDTGPVGVASE